MLASPFAFFRGAAAVMANDLAVTPSVGLQVQASGDAHLANFGGFAAPDRTLVFDMNDFDESTPGPFEWDVKRLATSFAIAARAREFSAKEALRAVRRVVRSYRTSMATFATMPNLAVWYSRIDAQEVVQRWRHRVKHSEVKQFERNVAKAERKDSLKAWEKLTELVDGRHRIISDPPTVIPLDELPSDVVEPDELIRGYRHSLQPSRRRLLETYELTDFARKVVGVGSVGTRCWIGLLIGRDNSDPLFLQVKEAEASVLEPHVGTSEYANHGQRVVEGQRTLQAAGDVFLGWTRSPGTDGAQHDFYVRQLWDWKYSPLLEAMTPEIFGVYAELCGWTLARGHARSGDRIAIGAYLGTGHAFDHALATFAEAYADQNDRDYRAARTAFDRRNH
jgi:uncharacterized protein (DUF2252 family)